MIAKYSPSLLALLLLSLSATSCYAVCDFGPDTCLPGFVWREAFAGDHVCVTGAVRAQVRTDNALAGQRKSPTGGAFGPDTCLPGFVWREASPTDHVCVPGSSRAQAAADNAQAAARKDPRCAAPAQDTTPPGFIQNTLSFIRVTDNLAVGSEVIPPAGLTKTSIPKDRKFVIAASAGDSESGVASIRLQGGLSWNCTDRLKNIGSNLQATLSAQSDEEKNNTSAAGSSLLRSAHFTVDPFDANPSRTVCPCTNDTGPLTATLMVVARNGQGLETTSGPITVVYAAQPPTCGAASGAICGNKTLGQVLTCADGRACDFKRSTVCSGWWIFRTCDKIQTTDMFCP